MIKKQLANVSVLKFVFTFLFSFNSMAMMDTQEDSRQTHVVVAHKRLPSQGESQGKRLCLAYYMDEETNRRIHDFVRAVVPDISLDTRRHVGIIWIENVQDEDFNLIKETLHETVCEVPVIFTPAKVDRYIGRGHTFEKCPLVLYSTEESAETFKLANRILAQRLDQLCIKKGFHYQLKEDLQPNQYLPHITLLNQTILREFQMVNRKDETIEALNDPEKLKGLSPIIIKPFKKYVSGVLSQKF